MAAPRVCRVGDAVEALWPEDEEWYNATIVAVAPDGRLSLAYEDGDFRDDGLPSEVRHLAPEAPVAPIAVAGGDDDDGLGDILDGILDAPTPSGAVVPPAPLGPAESEALRKLSPRRRSRRLLDAAPRAPPPEAPAERPAAAAPAAAAALDDDFGDMLDGILDDDDGGGGGESGDKLQARIRGRRGAGPCTKRREHKQTHGAATALQARIRGRKGRRTVLEQRGLQARCAQPGERARLLPSPRRPGSRRPSRRRPGRGPRRETTAAAAASSR
ncbi:hypothetical protein JL721_3357 [Aureococcus anophagefferens]|nr:hypothetical protein JL721_3357 [Aureococcus anophagefferens]